MREHRRLFGPVPIALCVMLGCLSSWAPVGAQPLRIDPSQKPALFAFQQESETGPSDNRDGMTIEKSAQRAFRYSLYGTLIPLPTVVLTGPGLIFGPSLGYFNAGLRGRAWTGVSIRAVALGGVISAFAICPWECGPGDDGYTPAWIVFTASSGILVGSAIYDIATVKRAVRRHYAQDQSTAWSVSPAYFVQSKSIGIRVHLSW